jgi:hypothetical protein
MSNNKPPLKPVKTAIEPQSPQNDAIHQTLIDKAITEGQSLLNAGKSKTETSLVIYKMLEALDQQTIIQAFIKGANLTPMGAVTYWYNCRRKLLAERKQSR